MKKYKKIAYIVLIIIILISIFFIYNNIIKKQSGDEIKSKTLSEIKYMENKFVDLFNQMNNIDYETYKISTTDIKKSEKEESKSSESSKDSSKEENSNSNQSGDKSNSEESSSSSENNKKYELSRTSILTEINFNPNWELIKNEVEDIYVSIYPTTLDLYEAGNNQEDVLNFNKEYDNFTKAVKEENKENALMELSLLYDYLPKFIENSKNEEKEKILLNTKKYIFKAYSILEQENWEEILNNIKLSIEEFKKLVTNVENKDNKDQYNINKIYVMLNELQNAILLQDKELFLIKYKNILEEMEKM